MQIRKIETICKMNQIRTKTFSDDEVILEKKVINLVL